MTKRAITNWWIEGLIAMIPSGILIASCAVLLATHPQGVSDGYGRTMMGFIVMGGVIALVSAAKRCRVPGSCPWAPYGETLSADCAAVLIVGGLSKTQFEEIESDRRAEGIEERA